MDDIIGNRVGRLIVEEFWGRDSKHGHPHYICRCDCGNTKVIARGSLLKNATKSCGCLRNEKRFRHGGSYDNAYWSWKAMIRRCTNPSHDSYPHYGGRGIKVCDRWMIYENFKHDMGDRPKGLSIDRIDPDGNYEPGNCKWSTSHEQSNNRRYNRIISYEGKEYTCSQLARAYGIEPSTLNMRLYRYNWPIKQALGVEPRAAQSGSRDLSGRFVKGVR